MNPETSKLIGTLAAMVVSEPKPYTPDDYQRGWITKALVGSAPAASDDGDNVVLSLVGEEAIVYSKCLRALQANALVEHLDEKEIEKALWAFVSDLFTDRMRFKNGMERAARIQELSEAVERPHHDYQVAIVVNNLMMREGASITVADTEFVQFDKKLADEWRIHEFYGEVIDDLIGKTMGLRTATAGTSRLAIDRAIVGLRYSIKMLRVLVSGARFIHDDQLLMDSGSDILVRNLAEGGHGRWAWRRGRGSVGLEMGLQLRDFSDDDARPFQVGLDGTLPSDLSVRFRRAVDWLGASFEPASPDEKIRDVFTALEALVATKSDKRKGEAVSIRSILLGRAAGRDGFWLHPADVLSLYELRSSVVHGSKTGVGTQRHADLLFRFVKEVLADFASVCVREPFIKRVTHLIDYIEAPEALEWCEHRLEDYEEREIDLLQAYILTRRT